MKVRYADLESLPGVGETLVGDEFNVAVVESLEDDVFLLVGAEGVIVVEDRVKLAEAIDYNFVGAGGGEGFADDYIIAAFVFDGLTVFVDELTFDVVGLANDEVAINNLINGADGAEGELFGIGRCTKDVVL